MPQHRAHRRSIQLGQLERQRNEFIRADSYGLKIKPFEDRNALFSARVMRRELLTINGVYRGAVGPYEDDVVCCKCGDCFLGKWAQVVAPV